MGNTMGKKKKLGSASSAKWVKPESNVNTSEPLNRSFSMPLHNAKTKSEGRHVVKMTSSTYGILKVDKPKGESTEERRTSMTRGRSLGGEADMNFNLHEKVRKFDVPEIPRPWSDVDENVTKLKPAMSEGKGQRQDQLKSVKEEEPETINMWELMEGLDDDTRSPLPVPPSASPHATKPGTVAKKVRNLEMPRDFSSMHSVTEADAEYLEEVVKSELQSALENDTLIKGKCYTHSPSSTSGAAFASAKTTSAASLARHGSGKENAPSSLAVQRDSSLSTLTPVKLNSSANVRQSGLVDSKGNSGNIRSAGALGSTPNKAGGVVVESPKTPVKAIVENSAKVSTGSRLNHNSSSSPSPVVDVSPRGVVSRSSQSPRTALQHARFGNPYISPSGFPTTSSSSDNSEEQQQIPSESPLFDPELLASFEKAIEDVSEDEWYRVRRSDAGVASTSGSSSDGDSPLRGGVAGVANSYSVNKTNLSQASPLARSNTPDSADAISRKMSSKVAPVDFRDVVLQKVVNKVDPFEKFEEMCPPGGEGRIVIYVTSLRGIRKTFEDCSHMKLVIMGYRVAIDERDVSMHADFRQELKDLLGRPMPVPRLFIKGRYIGGSEEVSLLHEDGTLAQLLESMPTQTSWEQCDGCGGHRFVPCSDCSGSCKVITEDDQVARCTECNENGLVRCPICF